MDKNISVAAGAAPLVTVDIVTRLEELMKQGEDYIWRPAAEAASEIRQLRREVSDLLAALKKLTAFVGNMSFHPKAEDRHADDLVDAAKTAIARAEGR